MTMYQPGTVLGHGDMAVNKTIAPALMKPMVCWRILVTVIPIMH